jgi:hypothetical protein
VTNKEKILEAESLVNMHGSVRAASRESGIPRSTIINRLKSGRSSGILDNNVGYRLPPKLDDDIPVDDIVDQLHQRFKKRKKYREAKKWSPIYMNTDEPIGLLWLGDPHIDDNHCDWDALREHLDIINNNDGVYGCSLGDQQNNWVGRLGRLYSEQDTSHKTAWKLVEWLIQEMNPMILIGGNHDMWSGAGDPLKWIAEEHTVFENWEARIALKFPNKRECKIFVAHDMAGHSQWNPLHAQTKTAKFRSHAHLYISGHKHNWALGQIELVEEERTAWLARARGYKYHDTYAFVKGFEQQKFGQAIMQVIDPTNPSEVSWVQCFADPQEGADYLQYRRSLRK